MLDRSPVPSAQANQYSSMSTVLPYRYSVSFGKGPFINSFAWISPSELFHQSWVCLHPLTYQICFGIIIALINFKHQFNQISIVVSFCTWKSCNINIFPHEWSVSCNRNANIWSTTPGFILFCLHMQRALGISWNPTTGISRTNSNKVPVRRSPKTVLRENFAVEVPKR